MVEVRALIGDRTADEVSDLSEADNDDDESDLSDDDDGEEDTRSGQDLPHILVESKTIIGGKNEVKSFAESGKSVAELLQPDSLVSEHSTNGGGANSPIMMEAKNEMIFMDFNEPGEKCDDRIRIVDQRVQVDDNVVRESSTDEMHASTRTTNSNVDLLVDFGGNVPVPAPR